MVTPPLPLQRYRMEGDVEHHAMSGHGGDPVAKPVKDKNGEWVRVDAVIAHLKGIMKITSPADDAAPALRKAADMKELARLFTRYYTEDFGLLMDTIQSAREAAERASPRKSGG